LAVAVSSDAPIVILSGGYGVLQLTEPIGWYERRLQLVDWPSGLLGREIAAYAHHNERRSVVAFAASGSPYARVLRESPWGSLNLDRVLLVTVDAPGGGAQFAVPRDLGLGFSAWYRGIPSAAPDSLRVEDIYRRAAAGYSGTAPGLDAATDPPAAESETDVHRAVAYLRDRFNAVPAEAIDASDPVLNKPGLYAWWVDEAGLRVLRQALGEDIGSLIYAGQAGATTRRRAITSGSTLRSRVIGQHLGCQTRGSTFALTLASALSQALDIEFEAPQRIDAMSRHTLQRWMREHLSVAMFPVPDPTHLAHLESAVLGILDPPLNLDGRTITPVRARLSRLRRAPGDTA
jgi:hypothetical protein